MLVRFVIARHRESLVSPSDGFIYNVLPAPSTGMFAFAPGILLATPLTERPRDNPYERNSRIGLPVRASGGEAQAGPGMEDSRLGEKFVGQFPHPRPRQVRPLAAARRFADAGGR